jgi:formylglycine-generating enzyme required for sulfatase activity
MNRSSAMKTKKRNDVLVCVFAVAFSCCAGGGNDDGGGDTDTGLDTDTSWDGGPLTECEGDPPDIGMVCVPGGTYLMGCMPYDTQCEKSEKPMVEVTLSPFWMDRKEAKVEEIIPFLNTFKEEDGYVRGPNWIYRESTGDEPIVSVWKGNFLSGRAPVCLNEETDEYEWAVFCNGEEPCTSHGIAAAAGGLSWLGAKMYCQYRGKRLPTEAEWEAAARGQTKWIYPCAWWFSACSWGAYDQCDIYDASCGVNLSADNCCIPYATTTCPSPLGVRGMSGNAVEWVLDHKDANHAWCQNGCTDPAPRRAENPLIKGGGVGSNANSTRISYRGGATGEPGPYLGVRCVSSTVDHVLSDGGVVWGN